MLTSLPPQETVRLRLRPLGLGDAEPFRAMTDDPVITSAVHFLASPVTLEAAAALLRGKGDGRDCFWGVWPRDQADLVGTLGTHLRDAEEIEIGYWFSGAVHGRGYATESLLAILGLLVTAYPKRRIYAECRPENAASWRVLQRAGFRSPGIAGARPGRMKLTYEGEDRPPPLEPAPRPPI